MTTISHLLNFEIYFLHRKGLIIPKNTIQSINNSGIFMKPISFNSNWHSIFDALFKRDVILTILEIVVKRFFKIISPRAISPIMQGVTDSETYIGDREDWVKGKILTGFKNIEYGDWRCIKISVDCNFPWSTSTEGAWITRKETVGVKRGGLIYLLQQ